MLRNLTILTISILFSFNSAFSQVDIEKPIQEPTHVVEPSTEIIITKSAFWDINEASQAGQWNPKMISIHAPLESNNFKYEEIRQKTEEKLRLERERTEPWIDEEGSQRSSSLVGNPIIGESWQGLAVNGWAPPDNAGAISGSGNIVTCINSRIGFYDEEGNNLLDQSLSDFFSPINAGATVFDPKVEYSNYHNNFIVVALDGNTPSSTSLLIAFSVSSNPLDGFWMYSYDGDFCDPGDVWFDYPNIGISAQELFVAGNLFTASDNFQESFVFQIELADAWTGGTLSGWGYCDIEENGLTNGNAFTVKPLSMGWTVTNNGIVMVSCDSGSDDYFYYHIDNSLGNSPSLNAYSCSGEDNWSSPGNVQQSGTTQLLDAGGTRIRDAFYLDGVIYTVSGADRSDGFGGIMYAEIDFSSGDMLDQEIFGGSGIDYTYPSIEPWAANSSSWDGTTVIGFLRSNSSMFPQFRAVKHNPDGTWGSSFLLKGGESFINNDRWGDYIDGSIRENSGQAEVWFFGQYGVGNGYGNWVSQLVEYVDGCTDSQACNYDSDATNDDGSCEYDACTGCMDSAACNYDSNATISAPCTYPGCTNWSACNYNMSAGCDDGSCCSENCIKLIMLDSYGDGWNGATYSLSNSSGEVVASGTMENDSEESVLLTCIPDGCYDFTVTDGYYPSEISWSLENYNWIQIIGADYTFASGGAGETQSLTIGGGGEEGGCTDVSACNYDATAICDNGSCCYSNCLEISMNDSWGDGWNNNLWEVVSLSSASVVASGTLESGTTGIDYACLDAGCYEFRINIDNGMFSNEVSWSLSGADQLDLSGNASTSVTFSIAGGADESGCTDSTACNYDYSALCDDGSCCYGICGSLWMLDSYGDGWNGSALQIVDEMGSVHFETTLTNSMGLGEMYEVSVCLDPGCYLVNVSGNTWPEEVSWLLNMGGDGESANWIIGGGAPENNLVIGVNEGDCYTGCTYPTALNYDAAAFVLFDDGLCEFETCDSSCVGDLNNDGYVNTADLLEFLGVFGTNCII